MKGQTLQETDERAVQGTTGQTGEAACPTLLVDDQQGFLDLVRGLLQEQPGIHVVGEATSGEEAIALLPRLKPEAVVLDVQMPGMNGFETARRLLEVLPNLRIVITSAFDDPHYVSLARSVGARAFFSKRAFPVDEIARVLQGR